MGPGNFTEEDKEKVVKFLNAVAKHARYDVDTNELIELFGLLSYMQRNIIAKIDANILEVKNVIPPKEPEKKAKKGKKGAKK